MNHEEFNYLVGQQMDRCTEVLGTKAMEYATDDRLHNFKIAAKLQGLSLRETVAGMMAKHTVSIYDMCKDENEFVLDIWNEKITDHINYLLLLNAVINEERFDKVIAGQDMTFEPEDRSPQTAGQIANEYEEGHA